MAWCFQDETSAIADAALAALADNEAIVPDIWPLEVANVLVLAEKKGRITAARVPRCVSMLQGLPISVDLHTREKAFTDILSLARSHQITAYDAAYLELAIREGVSLATLDEGLGRAARAAGVEVFRAGT
jgi:predicted nucleic acid-binding protein